MSLLLISQAEMGLFPWVAEGRAAQSPRPGRGKWEEVAPVLEGGSATAVASEMRWGRKERRFHGCHGSGSMGPWQESKKYSLQAYSCGFITKSSVKTAEINLQLIFPRSPYFGATETQKHIGQGPILL